MKQLITLMIVVFLFSSCSAGWKIGTHDKKQNLKAWKAEKEAKKAEKAKAHDSLALK